MLLIRKLSRAVDKPHAVRLLEGFGRSLGWDDIDYRLRLDDLPRRMRRKLERKP